MDKQEALVLVDEINSIFDRENLSSVERKSVLHLISTLDLFSADSDSQEYFSITEESHPAKSD
jgi:hypothetical protein